MASAKIHVPNRHFTPASLATSHNFQFKSSHSASDWQVLVATQSGKCNFVSLAYAGRVGPPLERHNRCWDRWSKLPTVVHPSGYSASTCAISCVVKFLTNNNSNTLLWNNATIHIQTCSSFPQKRVPRLLSWWPMFSPNPILISWHPNINIYNWQQTI